MTYFALKTEPHRERSVRRALKVSGCVVYLPAKVTRSRSRRPGVRNRRRVLMFCPGYVFVRVPDDMRQVSLWQQLVLGTRGARGFLTINGFAAGAPDSAIQEHRAEIANYLKLEESYRNSKALKQGQIARVKYGALTGNEGEITKLRGKKARIMIKFMGQFREVEVQIESLEPAKAKDLEAA